MMLNGEQQSVRALQWSVRFLRNRTLGKAEVGLDSGEGSNRGFGCSLALTWRNGVSTMKSRSLLGTSLNCRHKGL